VWKVVKMDGTGTQSGDAVLQPAGGGALSRHGKGDVAFPGPRPDESAVVEAVATAAGTAVSFDAFFRDAGSRMVSFAFLLTGDLPLAQDLAQESLARAWQHWPDVGSYADPEAWARRVCHNLAVSHWRRVRLALGVHHLRDRERVTPGPSPQHVLLAAALRSLPSSQRQALVLHDGLGYTVAEVAAELGAPEGTVKSWLSRGRSSMARKLGLPDDRPGPSPEQAPRSGQEKGDPR
jgi:RNA polymerase sigma-70 factor (ECF subfamily)